MCCQKASITLQPVAEKMLNFRDVNGDVLDRAPYKDLQPVTFRCAT